MQIVPEGCRWWWWDQVLRRRAVASRGSARGWRGPGICSVSHTVQRNACHVTQCISYVATSACGTEHCPDEGFLLLYCLIFCKQLQLGVRGGTYK